MTLPNDQIFCGLNNGKFLIWDLSSNTTQEDDGHGMNRSITNIIKHQNCVLTSDIQGKI